MKLRDLLNKWDFKGLKVKTPFLDAEITFDDADRNAAWDLYVELLTRITTQRLDNNHGDEATALSSIFSIFKYTRNTLQKYGPRCVNFTKVAIIILNQVIRPFTAKWHKLSLEGAFEQPEQQAAFRAELATLQEQLRHYTGLLSAIAGVEDLTDMQEAE